MPPNPAHARLPATLLLTAAAMLAFAGNSLLCRLALKDGAIDAGSFTAVRLLSGAAALVLIVLWRGGRPSPAGDGSGWSALMLFVYAAAFSYAYVSLDAATGALLLFGFVQLTMIVVALWRGERPGPFECLGWLLAAAGLTGLLLPGAGAPSLTGAVLMAAAGVAWGTWSVRGAGRTTPLRATTANFVLALPFLLLLLPGIGAVDVTPSGVSLAILSGALTSGVGYVLWYAALRALRSLQAALVQLSVPAIAAAGGVVLLGEVPGWRLLVTSVLILGGIALALLAKPRR